MTLCPYQKLESLNKKEGELYFEKCTDNKLLSPFYAYGKIGIIPSSRTACNHWNGNECSLESKLTPKEHALKKKHAQTHYNNSYRNSLKDY